MGPKRKIGARRREMGPAGFSAEKHCGESIPSVFASETKQSKESELDPRIREDNRKNRLRSALVKRGSYFFYFYFFGVSKDFSLVKIDIKTVSFLTSAKSIGVKCRSAIIFSIKVNVF